MLWKAQFTDGEVVQSDDLIYRFIQNRINDIDYIQVDFGGKIYKLSWIDRSIEIITTPYSVNIKFTWVDIELLTNIRPICFCRDRVDFDLGVSPIGMPSVFEIGLGLQGNYNNKNYKHLILINKNGGFRIE